MFGTEIHATLTSNILKKDWISRMPAGFELIAVVATGLISTLASGICAGISGLAISAAVLTLVAAVQYYLFLNGIFTPLITPVVLGFVAGLVLRLIIAPASSKFGQRGKW
jgi:CHASE2 domain-containing sensor protein